MYLIYMDSSGSPLMKEKENYVLSGIIVNETNWTYIDNKVTDIKIKHFPNMEPDKIEIHAKDMVNRDNNFKSLTYAQIFDVFTDVYNLLGDINSNLKIISVLIQKDRIYPTKSKYFDTEEWGHRLIIERIEKYLEKINKSSSTDQYGVIIEDTVSPKYDERTRNKVHNIMADGTLYSKINYLIEDPLFTDSKWRNLSQLVDCVAYCVRREFMYNQAPAKKQIWDNYFKIISANFDSNNGNYNGYGLKIFPR